MPYGENVVLLQTYIILYRVMKDVFVSDDALRQAASEGMDAFIRIFVNAIHEAIGGELTAE